MRTHIDWISFTFPPLYSEGTGDGYTQALADGLREMFGMKLWVDVFDNAWEKNNHGRAPYQDSWTCKETGITVFASPSLPHSTCEISGQGCEHLIQMGYMEPVLNACAGRVTRIDVATDIETSIRPSEFVETLAHERMRARGYQISETGETCYVGSKSSDRYARVYRYNPPHPRAHLLRIEHVFRRDYAKTVAMAINHSDAQSVAASAGEAFGWAHRIWQPDVGELPDIAIVSGAREGGKTISWLVKSCAPAFKRLVANGTIRDASSFIEQYFLT